MMQIEFNFTLSQYQARLGETWTEIMGQRCWYSLIECQHTLAKAGLRLGRKVSFATWEVVSK
jgi:hypothetical protein